MRIRRVVFGVVCLMVIALHGPLGILSGPADAVAQSTDTAGVYLQFVDGTATPYLEVVSTLRDDIDAGEWELLTDYEASVEADDCTFRAHVFGLSFEPYATAVLEHGPTAAFALPLRLAVFEDEAGVHIVSANPLSLNRTIVAEEGFDDRSMEAVDALRGLVSVSFADQVSQQQYGQMRDEGLIKKTMGVIAGGPFDSKIEKITSVKVGDNEDLESVAVRLYEALEAEAGTRKWKTRPTYLYNQSHLNAILIGITGDPIEARAFRIVGSGNNDARANLACPGVDHAAAFPFAILLTRNEDRIEVYMVDAMFRMKMYFEDAGKMKFAANMRMPGSIEDEVRDKIEESVY